MQTATITTTKWEIDPLHTEVQFKVKHLVISTVTGFFKKFNGGVETDGEDFDGARVNFSLDVSSIDTNQPDRDKHLKSADFFAADEYPKIEFTGEMKKESDENYRVTGDLTIRGTTKKVQLDANFGGITVDPWGKTKAGFEISGKINRKEFGLNWHALTEAGGVVVSDEVKLIINAELAKV